MGGRQPRWTIDTTAAATGPDDGATDESGPSGGWWPAAAVPALGGLLVLCLPLGKIGQFRVAGFPLSLAKLVAIGLVAALAADLGPRRSPPGVATARSWFLDLDRGAQATVAAVACLAVGLMLRPDVAAGDPVPWLQLASSLALVPLVALSWPRISRRHRRLIAAALAALTLLVMLVTIQSTVVFNYNGSRTTRFGGTLSDPNDWAGALLAVLAILWSQWTDLTGRSARWVVVGLAGGLGLALVLTQSRGGFVALVVAAAAYALLTGGRRGRLGLLAAVLLAVAVFFGLRATDGGPFGDSIAVRRVLALPGEGESEIVDATSVSRRFTLVAEGGATFLERPVIGHGAGTFAEAVDYRLSSGKVIEGHNILGVAGVEHGILGLAGALLLALPGPFWTARSPAATGRRLAAGFFGLWVMGMTIDVLDNTYFWIVLGLAWAETGRHTAQPSRARA